MNNITVTDLHARLAAREDIILVDVREPYEHDEFNIGGINIPVTELPFRIDEIKAAGTGQIVLYCQSGNRSALAQKLLDTQFNMHQTLNLIGGAKAWRAEYSS